MIFKSKNIFLNLLAKIVIGSFLFGCASSEKSTVSCVKKNGLSISPYKGSSLPDGEIVLTYDDGPTEYTKKIGDYLHSEGIQATFFIQGSRVEGNEAILANLKAQGHIIANHTYNHENLTTSFDPASNLRKTDQKIYPYITGNIFLFRPPFGSVNEKVVRLINQSDMGKYIGPVMFDIGDELYQKYGADWACWEAELTFEECGEKYLFEINEKRKGVVLLHDLKVESYQMTKWLIPRLKGAGIKVVRIDRIPALRSVLQENEAEVDKIGGYAGCVEFEK